MLRRSGQEARGQLFGAAGEESAVGDFGGTVAGCEGRAAGDSRSKRQPASRPSLAAPSAEFAEAAEALSA